VEMRQLSIEDRPRHSGRTGFQEDNHPDAESVDVRYVHNPFPREPDFGAANVNYELAALLGLSEEPA